jgi:hypothetical protein
VVYRSRSLHRRDEAGYQALDTSWDPGVGGNFAEVRSPRIDLQHSVRKVAILVIVKWRQKKEAGQ